VSILQFQMQQLPPQLLSANLPLSPALNFYILFNAANRFSKADNEKFLSTLGFFNNLQSLPSLLLHHTNNHLDRKTQSSPFYQSHHEIRIIVIMQRSEHDDINVFGLLISVYIPHVFITKTCFEEYFERGLHKFNIVGSVLVRPS
jgi:hypothetical protein